MAVRYERGVSLEFGSENQCHRHHRGDEAESQSPSGSTRGPPSDLKIQPQHGKSCRRHRLIVHIRALWANFGQALRAHPLGPYASDTRLAVPIGGGFLGIPSHRVWPEASGGVPEWSDIRHVHASRRAPETGLTSNVGNCRGPSA